MTNLLGHTRCPAARLYYTPGCPYLRKMARRHFAYNSSCDCAAASPMNDTLSGPGNAWNNNNVRPNASSSSRTTDRPPLNRWDRPRPYHAGSGRVSLPPVPFAPARSAPFGRARYDFGARRSSRWRLRSSPERRAGNVVAERLRQQAIHAQLPWIAKDRQPHRHARVPRFRRRAISPEHAIPPRQIEAEVAVGLEAQDGMVHAVHVGRHNHKAQQAVEPRR